jgi:shikimate dehydrogenase
MVIANRTIATARALVNELREAYVGVELEWCALADAAGPYDLVINGTSAGLGGLGALVAPSAARGAVCYDLLYSAAPDSATPFCAWARECGADSVVDGLGMLVEQAAQAFYIWRGVWPATLPVLDQLRGVTSLDA